MVNRGGGWVRKEGVKERNWGKGIMMVLISSTLQDGSKVPLYFFNSLLTEARSKVPLGILSMT